MAQSQPKQAAARGKSSTQPPNMKTNNPIIDLSNDDSPERLQRHGSIMDDRRSYRKQHSIRAPPAAGSSSSIIDLVNELSPSNNGLQLRRPHSPPHKRKRLTDNTGGSEALSGHGGATTRPLDSRQSSQRARDEGLITYNLLDLIDQFRNKNVLTINNSMNKSQHSGSFRNNNPRQPFHYTQNDKWSCGFRNLQMLISSMPENVMTIFPDGTPMLNELQTSFELLWAEGFDSKGAAHHNSKMVGKTGKISWIGAVEVWSYLSFRGIDATIIQFANTMENRNVISSFVWSYFSRLGPGCECQGQTITTSYQYANDLIEAAKQIRAATSEETPCLITCNCTLLPLYLQWAGHSVTIVGIRRERFIQSNGTPSIRYHLIVFDPQKNGEMLRSKLLGELSKSCSDRRLQNCLHFMELPAERLLSKDTQILLSTARVINEQERERCKERVGCISVVV